MKQKVIELHSDRAYTDAALTKELAASGAEVLTKPRPIHGRPGLYDKSDFHLDLRKKTETCPVLARRAMQPANARGTKRLGLTGYGLRDPL